MRIGDEPGLRVLVFKPGVLDDHIDLANVTPSDEINPDRWRAKNRHPIRASPVDLYLASPIDGGHTPLTVLCIIGCAINPDGYR
jgi:hypothetical protein